MNILKIIKNLWTSKCGSHTVEWVLVVTLVAVAAITAYTALGTTVTGKVENTNTTITNAW